MIISLSNHFGKACTAHVVVQMALRSQETWSDVFLQTPGISHKADFDVSWTSWWNTGKRLPTRNSPELIAHCGWIQEKKKKRKCFCYPLDYFTTLPPAGRTHHVHWWLFIHVSTSSDLCDENISKRPTGRIISKVKTSIQRLLGSWYAVLEEVRCGRSVWCLSTDGHSKCHSPEPISELCGPLRL